MSDFDLRTGIEIELVLPPGMGRLELLDRLGARFGLPVTPFEQPSKVPVPAGLAPDATIALIQDIARHHQATVRSVSPDFRFFYLSHRAGRLGDALAVVHDNTLPGGERVAELVSKPLWAADVPWLCEVVAFVGAIEGVSIPSTAALHVHLDGAPFLGSARSVKRLVAAFSSCAPALAVLARTPPGLRRAQPLPPGFVSSLAELPDDAPYSAVEALIRAWIVSRGFALNLYNLTSGEPEKLTVELKLAGSTLDPAQVSRLRALFVGLARIALSPEESLALPSEPSALAERLLSG